MISSFTFHEVSPNERGYACQEVFRVLKPGGWFTLLDIIFASNNAMQDAAERLSNQWDASEVYALVGELDAFLHEAHFQHIYWQQTGPFHWAVCAQKPQGE
jgi:ubiquinone/menaquinone biosynthesis C-methylase UbiE